MNVLLNKFPQKIRIDDTDFEIKTDFRNCLKIILAYEDTELTIQEKHYILLQRLYKTIPNNIEEAIRKGISFLNCGKEDSDENSLKKRIYSFDKDYQYIYSAMNQTHNIDLESIEYLHWWKFVFYFMDVSKDCTFSFIVSLRDKKNKGKLDKEEKKVWAEMIEILDLNFNEEEDEEENEFMRKFNES